MAVFTASTLAPAKPKRIEYGIRSRTPGTPGRLHHAAFRYPVVDRQLPPDRRLAGVGKNPGREDRPGRDRGRAEEKLTARAWRRGLPDRHEVVVHAAQRAGPEIHPVQLGRIRARYLQGSRHFEIQSAREAGV